jgi:hypothetical protein
MITANVPDFTSRVVGSVKIRNICSRLSILQGRFCYRVFITPYVCVLYQFVAVANPYPERSTETIQCRIVYLTARPDMTAGL